MVCVREKVSDLPCDATVMETDRGKGLSSVNDRKNDRKVNRLSIRTRFRGISHSAWDLRCHPPRSIYISLVPKAKV